MKKARKKNEFEEKQKKTKRNKKNPTLSALRKGWEML